jgi:hypothetical protein
VALIESLIGPIASIIDKVIPDKAARDRAKLELLTLEGTQELQQIEARMTAIVAEARSPDPWTSRARPSFLYVMYTMLLFALPMGSGARSSTSSTAPTWLNLLGTREPEIYGHAHARRYRRDAEDRARELGLEIDMRQSNHEGHLIDWLHEAQAKARAPCCSTPGPTPTPRSRCSMRSRRSARR